MSFEDIYRDYYARLYRFAKVYVEDEDDAQNIVQDVFETLWERRRMMLPKIGTSTYLFTLVRNRCIDFLRHSYAVKKNEKELSSNLQDLMSMEHPEEYEAQISRLEAAINDLPPKCKEIIILCKIKGKTHSEAAKLLGVSVSTIETQISIAMQKLKKSLIF